MRISTSMVYDAGVRKVNEQTSSMLRLQQQISTGRRIVSPSDDPVAAARALELTQASDVISQFSRNRDSAQSSLALQETQLQGVGELVTRVRELAIQLGNGTLTKENRTAVTAELRARYEELLGYANSRDGSGKYLFSGYMGDTRPYAGSIDTGVSYFGDDGQRQLQVSPSRVLEVSDSGRAIFERIPNGNGTFVSGAGIPADAVSNLPYKKNPGTAIIDGGAVTDPQAWEASSYKDLRVQFSLDLSVEPPVTYYDIVAPNPLAPAGSSQDLLQGMSLLTGDTLDGTNPTPSASQRVYRPGQAIELKGLIDPVTKLPLNMGANVMVTGDPIARDMNTGLPIDPATGKGLTVPPPAGVTNISGDVFTLTPSTTENMFDTLRNLILNAESPTGTAHDQALLANQIGFALTNLDQAEINVLKVRSQIGSRLNEVDSIQSSNEDLQIQYQQSISSLQDLDYAKAISDFTRKQTDLQAAQQSFSKITQLSLFDYLR